MSIIFLCHASEDKPVVEPIQLALAGAGHRVFYDEQSLPAGGDYHQRIRAAIAQCDLFVFVGSRASIAPGKFTLSELRFARERWPSPAHRVLPVLIAGLEPKELPAYLQAVTVLRIEGNAAAEVGRAVERLHSRLRQRRLAWWGAALVAAAAVTTTLGLTVFSPPPSIAPKPDPTPPVATPMNGQLHLRSEAGDYIGDGKTQALSSQNGVITSSVSNGVVSVHFEGDEHWSAEFAAPRGQSLSVGTYAGAQRTPFNNPLKPGMSVSGASRGCNELEGQFTIERLVVAPADQLQDLKLSFRQRCDKGAGELLGSIDVKANAAPR